MSAASPYVFVVGCPRSGTTLLQRILDHHPMLTVANDTHFIPKPLRGLGHQDPKLTQELVERVVSYHRFPRLGIPPDDARRCARGAARYSEFVSALYEDLARRRGKPLAGEKTPDYVRHLPLLHALFPRARVVHIIRDGRDVALSALEWAREDKGPGRFALWKREPVAVAALWWRRLVWTGRRDGAQLGPSTYREVLYEDLIDRTEGVVQEVAAFLRLPFDRAMLAYHEGEDRPRRLGLPAKRASLPPTPGLRNWRKQMARRDVELFEALAGDLLSGLRYERVSDRIPPEIELLGNDCREQWTAELDRRAAKARRSRPA